MKNWQILLLIFLGYMTWEVSKQLVREATWQKTQAKVQGIVIKAQPLSEGSGKLRAIIYLDLAFRTQKGDSIFKKISQEESYVRFHSDYDSSAINPIYRKKYLKTEGLTILYNPKNPQEVELKYVLNK